MIHPQLNPQRVGVYACLMAAFLLVTLAPSPASAQAQHLEVDVPVGPLFVPCLGEQLQGVFHASLTSHFRESANGGFHVTENVQVGGLIVGLSSGIEWEAHGASNFKINTQGEQFTASNVETIINVAPGGVPNLLTKIREALVVNANGVVSRSFLAESFECSGPGGS